MISVLNIANCTEITWVFDRIALISQIKIGFNFLIRKYLQKKEILSLFSPENHIHLLYYKCNPDG